MKNQKCTTCKAGIMCQCNNKNGSPEKVCNNNVNHPDHYLKNSGHEVIDVINAWKLNFELGNAVKYIARAGRKDKSKKKEDLEKAHWYIKREIEKN